VSTAQALGKSFSALVCKELAACFLLAAATSAFAQHVTVGIKAGVPLTDVVQVADFINGQPFQAHTKRYTIGPIVDIGLPWGFGIEIGAMYKRFDQQVGQVTVTFTDDNGQFAGTLTRPAVSSAGQSLEIPLAIQYHFRGPLLHPYVEAGFSYNHLSDVFGPGGPDLRPPPPKNSEDRAGFLLGAGVAFKLHRIHLAPGLRYTRYTQAQEWLPSANAVDLLLGVTF
jgi:hypothetical protein